MAIVQFGDCIDNQQFIRSEAIFEFSEAVQFCEAQEEGKIVTFTNAEEFQAFNDFTEGDVWVGIIDDGNNGNGVTSRFEIIGESNRDFINTGVTGEFPWGFGQPNGIDSDQDCVRALNGLIFDFRCDSARQVVCQISGCQPTMNPTTDPTENPTQIPTKSPTKNQTNTSTLNPTENPKPVVTPEEESDSDIDLAVIIGGVVPPVALIILIAVIVIFVVKKKQRLAKDDFAMSFEERAQRDKEVFQKNQDALHFSTRDVNQTE